MDEQPKPIEQQQLKHKRRRVTLFYWGLVLLIIILGALFWFWVLRFEAYTNDAYVHGNQVYITPLRPGFVTAIHTDDTFLVKKGQLLVELDRTDSIIALERSQKQLANTVREICQAFHEVFTYRADIEARKAELIRTMQDYQHRADVLSVEGVSLEDYEHAVAALRATYFSLKATESLFNKSLAYVQGTSITHHPAVDSAVDDLRNMWVQLYRCNIYSPVEGLVAQRTIQVGMWTAPGEPLLSVIPLDQIWVNANFKETQMAHMRIGQPVKVTSDFYGPEVVYHGHIVGLPGGAGNAFSLLPPQNLSGNWIKIVQRLPVRVALDPEDLKCYPLRVGLSMEARVDLHDQEGLLVPTSPEGSPVYQTSIFEQEEKGDLAFSAKVINDNIDPSLERYADAPLVLDRVDVDAELQYYLQQMPKEVFLF